MNEGRPKADRCNAPKARRRFPVVRGACHYRREGEARPLQRVEDKTTTLGIVAYRPLCVPLRLGWLQIKVQKGIADTTF